MSEEISNQELLVEKYIQDGNNEEAIKNLLFLITKHAQQRDFETAEAMREKIISIDPMALSEAIQAQEIIDSIKMKPADSSHMEIWSELYERLTVDEANALYNEMDEVTYNAGQTIFEQGGENSNLYFIDSGVAKYLFTEGKREMFIKKINPGTIAGTDTFFEVGKTTCSLVAIDRVKVRCLPSETLLRWEGTLPALEPKLRDFCSREEQVYELLKKNSMDRRKQLRVLLPGRILIKLVNNDGKPVGKTLRGDTGDVSVGGISFYIQVNNRKQAKMLLGHDLFLRFNMPPNMKQVERIGMVLGVRQQQSGDTYEGQKRDRYSIHIKFGEMLAETSIREAAKYLKMLDATQH
jgi:CRP-like cAMP-binding protein